MHTATPILIPQAMCLKANPTPGLACPDPALPAGYQEWLMLKLKCNGLFGVIYCDPPWRHDFFKSKSRSTENHYPTMTTPEICALQVPSSENCVLFMWATAPKLTDAMQVIEAWGFAYRTHAIWDKLKIGLGYWFRGQHELLMVSTRGHKPPPPEGQRISSVIRSPRSSHSSKPDQVRDWIAKWYPNERKLEMFARPYTEMWPKHVGWETWGNELTNDVEITLNEL